MIDFPASPTVDQLFTASNGGTYKWNGTFWLPIGNSSSLTASDTPPTTPSSGQLWFNSVLGQLFVWFDDGSSQQWVPANPVPMVAAGGDFCAVRVGPMALSTTPTVMGSLTVSSGNTGSWLNVSTGRYTPPAGRYSIFALMDGRHDSSTTAIYLVIRKNGTDIPGYFSGPNSTAALTTHASVGGTVDASGTDYFEIAVTGVTGTTNGSNFTFGAFPISGIKGPPGDPGLATLLAQNAQTGSYTLVLGDANGHLYHAVAAAAATYTIPANAAVAYPIGTTLSFVNDSVNNVTIAITTDTMVLSPGTTTGSRTLATGGVATALKVTATRWVISGTGLT